VKVIGAKDVKIWGPADEVPHTVGKDPDWQESVALLWFDRERGVGGVQRIGHEPYFEGGSICLWSTIFTLDGWYYKKTPMLPLRPEDLDRDGFGAGDTHRFFFDGQNCNWAISDGDVSARLTLHDNHPPISNIPVTEDSMMGDYFGGSEEDGHTEASGRITGELEVRGKRYDVDGWYYRDHSWGGRHWAELKSHRWVCGIFDTDLSFNAFSWHSASGQLSSFGYLRRDDTILFAEQVDIVSFTEIDAFTHRGGRVRMRLPGGEVVEIESTPICKGTACHAHGVTNFDQMCTMRMGEREGVGVFETTTNPTGGARPPTNLVNGVIEDGLNPVDPRTSDQLWNSPA